MKLILIVNNIEKEYKSLRSINRDYPEFDYHQLREIYLQSTKKRVSKLQPRNKELFEHIKIIDKPMNFNKFTQPATAA